MCVCAHPHPTQLSRLAASGRQQCICKTLLCLARIFGDARSLLDGVCRRTSPYNTCALSCCSTDSSIVVWCVADSAPVALHHDHRRLAHSLSAAVSLNILILFRRSSFYNYAVGTCEVYFSSNEYCVDETKVRCRVLQCFPHAHTRNTAHGTKQGLPYSTRYPPNPRLNP